MNLGKLGSTTKSWTEGGKMIVVHAEQNPIEGALGDAATASIDISIDGKLVFEDKIPWPMPRGELFLGLQVHTLSTQPRYPKTQFQPIMAKFALMCEGFTTDGLTVFWEKGDPTPSR
jgi:hypothetical protein